MGRLPWWRLPRGTGTAAATMGGPSGFRPLGSASPGESSPGDYMVFLWFSLGNRQGQSITVVHSHCLGCVKEFHPKLLNFEFFNAGGQRLFWFLPHFSTVKSRFAVL